MAPQALKRPDDKNKSLNNSGAIATIAENNCENDDYDIDNSTAAVVVPQDSGWSWVVMVASFLCCTVIDGIVFSSSFIQEPIMKEFNIKKGHVSFVSSLLSGCYLMAGPFVSALANRFGFRVVTITGAIFASICFAISYFATSVEFLFITYGILGGIGFCMVYIPAVVIIGFYFEKWRALATGFALCGSGVGTIVFTPITNSLLEKFSWRYTLLAQAGIVLSCAIFGLTFRPIQPINLAVDKEEMDVDAKKSKGHGNIVAPRPQFQPNTFSKPLPEGRFAYSMPNSAHNTYMGASPKHHYPTAADVFKGANLERRPSNTSGGKGTEMKNLRKSQPTTPNGDHQTFTFNLNKELSTVGENEEETENENLLTTEAKPIVIQARRHTVSGRRPNDIMGRKASVGGNPESSTSTSRPMYRDDVFFTGSLTRIPQYQSQTSLAYHMSVTRLPTKQDMLEDRQKGCRLCPEAVRRTLSTMLDTSLLKSPSFMLLAFSGFLTMMGFFVPFSLVKGRALENDMQLSEALSIISGIGLINTIARIVCGSLSSFPAVKPLWLKKDF